MDRLKRAGWVLGMSAVVSLTPACGGDDSGSGGNAGSGGVGGQGGSGSGDLDIAVCDPANGPFSLTIDNPYLPAVVGSVHVLQGMEDGAVIEVRITVLDETEDVAGVTTRVVEEHETEDGEVVEISRNFFVQAPDGTVCYYGEDVDIYEGGMVVAHDGAWRAGVGENRPGILMPGSPEVGMTYQQELAPDVAMDRAQIVSMGDSITVPAGTYTDTLSTEETTPLEPGTTSPKKYAAGVGLIFDNGTELISTMGM